MKTRTGLLPSLCEGRRDGMLLPWVDLLHGLRACMNIESGREGWAGG